MHDDAWVFAYGSLMWDPGFEPVETVPARVAGSVTQGRDFWRVLVGPAATAAERDALLARVVAEGFADAYVVTN